MPLMAFLMACPGERIEVNAPQVPDEYLTCDKLPAAPDVEPLRAFQASNGAMVYYKADVDARDAKIAPYIVAIRGAWFSCSNQLGRARDYVDGVQ